MRIELTIAFSLDPKGVEPRVSVQQRMMRKPQRLRTIVWWQTAQRLRKRVDYEGRSLSNLMAHLLEMACPL